MNVAIVLLNWRNSPDTLACIESVLASHESGYQVIVCDNDSQDGSMARFLDWADGHEGLAAPFSIGPDSQPEEIAHAFAHKVIWVQTGGNLGFAGGNNVGVRLALEHGQFAFFWLLNNDCEVAPEALGALQDYMARFEDVGICGACLRYVDPPDRIQAYGGARHNRWTGRARYIGHLASICEAHDAAEVERSLSYVAGASMFVRREFIERVGLMQEDYFLYFEEIDWAVRGAGQFRLGYAPDAVVYHKEGATIGSSSDTRKTSALSDFYLFRNRLRFTARHYPFAVPVVWCVMLAQAFRRLFRGQADRFKLIVQILFGRRVY